jgi:hypothetical protein
MIKPNADLEIRRPAPPPLEYVGQWVAWNKALTEVVAHGPTFKEVRAAATAAGHEDAVFETVRRPGIFIGQV